MRLLNRAALLIVLFPLLPGCEHGKDSHTEVFKTPETASADRHAAQLLAHKELAISVLHFARPDIDARKADGAAITLAADGLTQPVDLQPIEEDLTAHANRERAIIRKYLDEQIRPFDERRVRELGFEKLKPFLRFDLVNEKNLPRLQETAGAAKLHTTRVVQGLYRATVIRRPNVQVAITEDLLTAWHTTPEAVDGAAIENLRDIIHNEGDKLFESTAYSSFGRTGTLHADAAVILLPEFLTAVQKSWQTTDDLLVILPSARNVQFIESRNQRLIDLVIPQWRQLLISATDPLFNTTLLRTKEGLEIHIATPTPATSAPAIRPTTKPETYIVH